MSANVFVIGSPSSGVINGATEGSTITASGLPTGLTINGAARTWSYNGTGAVATGSLALTETASNATNSPRVTNIGYNVNPGVPAAPSITLTPGDGQISIAWTDGAANGASITAHKLYAGASAGSLSLVGTISGASPYLDTGLMNGVARFYALTSINSVGESALSAVQNATPVNAVSTVNYTYAQIAGGLHGALDYTGTAGKVAFGASTTAVLPGYWTGKIKGTAASALMFQYGSDTPAGMVEVSINNDAFSAAPVVGGRYQLFTGLPDVERIVTYRINSAYGTSGNMPTTGNLLIVTGAPPALVVPTNVVQVGENNSNTVATNSLMANNRGGTFTPPSIINTANASKANNPALALRGNPSEILISSHGRYIYVSVDGAAPVRYDTGTANGQLRTLNLTGLSGTKTYYIWGAYSQFGLPQFAVGFVGGSLVNITTKQRMDQFGDSITEAVGATSPGESDVFRVAVGMGYLGGNFGFAGDTCAGMKARIGTILAGKTGSSAVGANDVAIIAIGYNDQGGTWSAQRIADYQFIVNALLTAGYRRVICRGIVYEQSSGKNFAAENASIQAIVTGFGDARVKFCDASGWVGIDTADGTHPNDIGYSEMAAYAAAAYPALVA